MDGTHTALSSFNLCIDGHGRSTNTLINIREACLCLIWPFTSILMIDVLLVTYESDGGTNSKYSPSILFIQFGIWSEQLQIQSICSRRFYETLEMNGLSHSLFPLIHYSIESMRCTMRNNYRLSVSRVSWQQCPNVEQHNIYVHARLMEVSTEQTLTNNARSHVHLSLSSVSLHLFDMIINSSWKNFGFRTSRLFCFLLRAVRQYLNKVSGLACNTPKCQYFCC